MKKHTAAQSQRGLSMVGWVIILGVVMVFGSAGVKLIPVYLEFNTISGIVRSTLQDSKISLKTEMEIMADIGKRFSINNIQDIGAQDLLISKESGTVSVTVDYEVRKNLFGNLDLVLMFDEKFSKDGSQ